MLIHPDQRPDTQHLAESNPQSAAPNPAEYLLGETSVILDCCWRNVPSAVRALREKYEQVCADADRLSLYATHLDNCPSKDHPDNVCVCGYNEAVSHHAKTIFQYRYKTDP
jgi:hypothetical protein